MDRRARVVGMLVFVVGIAMILLVFGIALAMFSSPATEVAHGADSTRLTATGLGSALIALVVKIALLFIMTLAGSMVAGKGIYLYLGGPRSGQEGEAD